MSSRAIKYIDVILLSESFSDVQVLLNMPESRKGKHFYLNKPFITSLCFVLYINVPCQKPFYSKLQFGSNPKLSAYNPRRIPSPKTNYLEIKLKKEYLEDEWVFLQMTPLKIGTIRCRIKNCI